jgi:N-carbamoyl-L-amino-acid hydrolase
MPDDFSSLLKRFSQFGATPRGGVRRLAASAEDGAARRAFAEEAEQRGARLHVDPIGNMFATFFTAPEADTTVLVGSHLDSQPTGGRFDGTLGVLAGLAVAGAIHARGVRTRHNITVANWTNEEGARFQPSLTGSSVFTGKMALAEALALEDRGGLKLGDELDAIGHRGTVPLPLRPVRNLELHVEQGDQLEAQGLQIGAVTSSWATRKFTIAFIGEPSHTGSTPMHRRRDALRGAAAAITSFHGAMEVEARQHGLHWAAAKIVAEPDSPNVVPSRVTVWFEIRNPEHAVTIEVGDRFVSSLTSTIDPLGLSFDIVRDEHRPGTCLDSAGVDHVIAAARELGLSSARMMTIIGHDALTLQSMMPSTLIFIPSVGGLSHNEAELTHDHDIRNGCAVLEATLLRFALDQGGGGNT